MLDRVLVVVDVQRDFMPGGALAVTGGDEVVPYINELIESGDYSYVVATQDWHPPNHGSFASQHGVEPFTMGTLDGEPQMMWPDHCVQGTPGAELHPDLSPKISAIIRKGMNPNRDSYSGVKDNGNKPWTKPEDYPYTGLDFLILNRERGGRIGVDVVGLATDYCVGFTAIDLCEEGYDVRVLLKGCRGVDPTSTKEMITRLFNWGIEIVE